MAPEAKNRSDEPSKAKGGGHAIAQQDQNRQMSPRWSRAGGFTSPFELMNRMSEEMDQMFDRMLGGFGLPSRSWSRGVPVIGREGTWTPRVEAFQQGDRFVVRADLPGMKKEDVQVELTDEALTIRGERHDEHEEQREGYFHSEREYGQFYRAIPLPAGVISESAQASFRNGVLEVSMQAAPSEANRGRKLEIKEAAEGEQKK